MIGVRADTRGDYCEGRGRGTGDKGWGGGILNLIPPGPGAGPSIATHEPGTRNSVATSPAAATARQWERETNN